MMMMMNPNKNVNVSIFQEEDDTQFYKTVLLSKTQNEETLIWIFKQTASSF